MGSQKAEFYLKSVGKKRKKPDARAFKALFKRSRIKEVLPDVDGKLEGPDNISHRCNGNGRVISSKPIGERDDASDECCKRLNGDSRHLSNDKASGGDLQKSICILRRADADIVGNNSNYIDDVVDESPEPLCADSITGFTTHSSTRKNFNDSKRLPNNDMDASESGSPDCAARPQQVDTAVVPVEVTESQGTEVAASKGGPYTITASNLTESLQIDSISSDDAPNSILVQSSFGDEVGIGKSDERFSSLSEQNNLHNYLRVEMGRLCQFLKLSEDVTRRVIEFLEYVIKNHDVSSDLPAIMQAFQLSVCWIATLISKENVDKKNSLILAKKHLDYQCTEEQVYSIYSKMRPLKLMYLQSSENTFDFDKDCLLADEDSSKEPFLIFNGASLFSLFKQKDAKIEIEETIKQKMGMNVKADGSEIHNKIKKIRKKNEKRMKKLFRKQEDEVQELLRTWEEEKVKFEKDHKLESAVIRCIHGQGLVRNSKLKLLDDNFAKKMEEHNLLKDMKLDYLKEKQLAALNQECQKAADAEAVACASELSTVNGAMLFGSRSEDGAGCIELSTHIKHIGPANVVTMFQEQSKDQNPSKSFCTPGNGVALSDTSISAPAETTDCDCLVETMNNMEAFRSPNEMGARSLERPPETPSGQLNQLIQSRYTAEEIGSANLPVCGEQAADEIQPVEMNQEGPSELTRPVSDDIVCHDPVELSYTFNIGDQIGSPNTEVNHRVEPCEPNSSSLPLPGLPLVHSEEILAFPNRCGLLKQHVSQDEIHQMAFDELDDRETPAAEIQNTSQVEVATLEQGDAVTLVQSNRAVVPETGNCEQLHHLSVDVSRICNQSPPHEIEHENGDQGTNFAKTVAAGETEEFSREFVSRSSENLHHNHLDLGQAVEISHEQSVELCVHSPGNTVVAEAVRTIEPQNQCAPQLRIDAGHFHESRNSDTEMTRSTCVLVSQDEIHQMASAELEDRDTPAAEIQDPSQTEVATLELGDTVTLAQSNHAVPATGNCEVLHNLSVDASLICNQSPPQEIEHQHGYQVTNFSQTVVAGETEELSREFVSQSTENLHDSHLNLGQESRISHELGVELSVCSPDNTVIAEAVRTIELPNQSVPQSGVHAGHLRRPHLLHVHPTHQITSWNSTPPFLAEPLQNELEKLRKEAEQLEKTHENVISQLKSQREKEIQEIINQIRNKYDMKVQEAKAEFRLKKIELEKNQNLVIMHTRLAETLRFKFWPLTPARPQGLQGLQQVFPYSFVQHLHQPSLHPPVRISPLASANQPPPGQQNSAPYAQALNQLHTPTSAGSSPVAIRNVTVSPPIRASGPVISGTSTRPPVIASITPPANPRIAEIRSRAPHLQPFRAAAVPSVAPSSLPALPQLHPRPIYRPQIAPMPRQPPPPPPLPQITPNHVVSQNAPEPQTGHRSHLNLSLPAIESPRDMNRHVPLNHNLPLLPDVDSTVGSVEPSDFVTLGNVQVNPTSSAVDTDIICLSDEE